MLQELELIHNYFTLLQHLVDFVGGGLVFWVWVFFSCVLLGFIAFIFFKENLKDLFLFWVVIQQHCVKLFNKRVRIFPSIFSKRKRLCGKACGKRGSSRNIHYVIQRGAETQEAGEKPAEWAVKSAAGKRKILHLQRLLWRSFLSFLTKLSLPQSQSQKVPSKNP